MPIYEYRCPKCGDFDVMQKITEKPLPKCPTCKAKVTKLMSNTAFQLKGTGWYVTDYGNRGKSSEAGESKKSDESSSKSSDAASASADSSSGEKKKKTGKEKKKESAAA